VLLCEWSGFKQPLFGDEARFSAAVIGAFLSSLSRGVVSSCFTMMKNFQLFYDRTKFDFADVGLNIAHAECAVFRFLTYFICKNKHIFFFTSVAPQEKIVIK